LLYNKFSEYLKNRYGTKVYKLPVNLPVSCPNRDGRLSSSGCIFCGEEGAGFENLPNSIAVAEQISLNSQYIGKNYSSRKFIAYFQNFSNTYIPIDTFKQCITDACVDNIVALYISTRPDCINDIYLDFLEHIKKTRGVDVVIELGLQTVNYHTLKFLNRGHLLAEFIDAIIRMHRHRLESCAHYIVDLPMDSMDDVIEGARILSALGVRQVKCHSMYILRDTELGHMYEKGEVKPVSMEEYIERVVEFLECLDPQIVIQRLIGRAPQERTLFCNWGASWWKIRDHIEEKMKNEGRYQGRKFNYLNGMTCMCEFTGR
jgi:radical SAM protein (TIGR01212 family)